MFLLMQQRYESIKDNIYDWIQIVLIMDAILRLKEINILIDNLETNWFKKNLTHNIEGCYQ